MDNFMSNKNSSINSSYFMNSLSNNNSDNISNSSNEIPNDGNHLVNYKSYGDAKTNVDCLTEYYDNFYN